MRLARMCPLLGRLFLLGVLSLIGLAGCPDRGAGSGPDPRRAITADLGGALRRHAATPGPRTVRLRTAKRVGVPLHPAPLSRRISGRLPSGTRVRILGERRGGRWLHIRAANGTSGWIVSRYVDWRDVRSRPARPRGRPVTCPPALGPSPTVEARPARRVTRGHGRLSPVPATLRVVSYNVWELYDGVGRDRYLSRKHAGSLAPADVKLRVAKLAAQIKAVRPHVIAFQEIEDADLACRVAVLAVPGARWQCGAGAWSRRDTPQNVAVATRVAGTLRVLTPRHRAAPRGAVELELAGGHLSVLAVHLKSSRGARGTKDCRNARRREAMARALVSYLQPSRGSRAVLLVGDFNFDPQISLHDHADDRLRSAGLKSLRVRFYPRGAPPTYPAYRSTIDLAFFRPVGMIAATGYRVLTGAKVNPWTSDHVPVAVTLRTR